jgi:hypothetical protein
MLDLWEYDTTATSFPWKKLLGNTHSGAPSNVKDTMKGIPSATITPHSSAGPGFCVDVMHNTLWMFGGMHSPVAVKMRRTNALWKYEMNSGEWTWVSGDANAAVPSGKIPSAAGQGGKSFFPGARCVINPTPRMRVPIRVLTARIHSNPFIDQIAPCGVTPRTKSYIYMVG